MASFVFSDNESDDEFMRTVQPVFSQRSSQANDEEEDSPELTQSTVQSVESPPPAEAPIAVVLTPEEIEVKAQKCVQDLRLPMVQKVANLADIGWRKTTEGKGRNRRTTYLPCIRLSRAEAHLMFPNGLAEHKTPVRYLGRNWKHANAWEQVVPTTFHSLHLAVAKDATMGEDDAELNLLPIEDDECLQIFLEHKFGSSPENAVNRRAEELFIRMSWVRVAENQRAKEAEQQTTENNQDPSADPVVQPLPPTKITSSQTEESDENTVDNDDDDEDPMVLSPNSKRKREVIRPDDIVEYYLPGRVFGNPDVLTRSKVVGVIPKRRFPLNLESGDFLDKDHKVRLIIKFIRGKRIDQPDAHFRPISGYSLRSAGTEEAVAFKRSVNNMKRTRENFDKEKESFWANGSEAAKVEPRTDAAATNDELEPPRKRLKQNCDESNEPEWRRRLLKLLEETETNMKNRRRYSPHFTPDDIQLVLKAWSILEKKGMIEQAIETLGNELDLSEMRVEAILQGNPKGKLSRSNKEEAMQKLQGWVDKEVEA